MSATLDLSAKRWICLLGSEMEKKALLFVNQKKPAAITLSERIKEVLEKRNYRIEIFSHKTRAEKRKSPAVDLCFSLGGDGTALHACRVVAPLGTPVMPVNLGSLGFIAAVNPPQWEDAWEKWEKGKAVFSKRLMLDVEVVRQGEIIFQGCCLNDAVISGAGIAKLVRLEVGAETLSGDRIGLGSFRADGLIVATPTGSTGYSVAAGGPIIDPEMDLVIINPICPFTLANRPIVVPSDERIIVRVENEQRSDVLLTMDGQITKPLQCDDRIIINASPKKLSLIASDRWAFYRALRTKLSWSGGAVHA